MFTGEVGYFGIYFNKRVTLADFGLADAALPSTAFAEFEFFGFGGMVLKFECFLDKGGGTGKWRSKLRKRESKLMR